MAEFISAWRSYVPRYHLFISYSISPEIISSIIVLSQMMHRHMLICLLVMISFSVSQPSIPSPLSIMLLSGGECEHRPSYNILIIRKAVAYSCSGSKC